MSISSTVRQVAAITVTMTFVIVGIGCSAAAGVTPGAAPLRSVAWGPVRFAVPADWPVYDLGREPSRCPRMDMHAVYLGAVGPAARCPASLIGRTEALEVSPAPAAGSQSVGGDTSAGFVLRLDRLGVVVTASYRSNPALARQILRSVTASGAPGTQTEPSAPRLSAPESKAQPGPAAAAVPLTTTTIAPGIYTGGGFDTCAAPSTATMTAWLASPYRGIGIYLGGANRACGDGNLSPSWVRAVTGQGWRLAPIYVGYQAPCVVDLNVTEFSRSSATAGTQGSAAADDAVGRAHAFGLPTGSPIYFDLEGYDTADSGCRAAVLAFLTAWTVRLHQLGFRSGVYSGAESGIRDLDDAVGRSGITPPDAIWFARWDGIASVWGDRNISDAHWTDHQRMKQYLGDRTESWGGVSMTIDRDAIDGPVVTGGAAGGTDYGLTTYGPGAPGFSTTGSWSSGSPYGLRAAMRWTYSSGSPATASATWAEQLSPGTYDVAAYVPANYAGGHGRYAITGGTSGSAVIDQGAYSDTFVSLGRFSTTPHGQLIVRLTNDGDPPHAHTIGADAMRFSYTGPLVPGAAWRAPADYNGDGRTDMAIWRPSSGTWYVYGHAPVHWGQSGDVPVPGNYAGTPAGELAVWRPSNGVWYIRGVGDVQWGQRGDIPVVADFTGDGRVDLAVWRWTTGAWWIRGWVNPRWGVPGDVPVPADFSGSGRAQVAVWRPSTGTWYVLGRPAIRWGVPGDIPTPTHFAHRGPVDLAVWRPSNGAWYVLGQPPLRWGEPGDIPRPGDYTGGGLADHTVWRPSSGIWYIKDTPPVHWGEPADLPT